MTNRLDLCPLQDGYSVEFIESVTADALVGGFDRYSSTTDAKKRNVSCSFNLQESDYIYLRSFYLNWQFNPESFIMELVIEKAGLEDYLVQFVPDSLSLDSINAGIFSCSFQLVVEISRRAAAAVSKTYPLEIGVENLNTSFDIVDFVKSDALLVYQASESLNTSFIAHDFTKTGTLISTKMQDNLDTSFIVGDFVKFGVVINQVMPTEKINTSFIVGDFIKRIGLVNLVAENEKLKTSFLVHDFIKE